MKSCNDNHGGNDNGKGQADIPSPPTPTARPSSKAFRLHGDKRQIVRPVAVMAPCGDDGDNGNTSNNIIRSRDHPSLLLFSNDRIKVSDFRLAPSQSVSYKHEYPTIRWQVAYDDDGVAEHSVKITSNVDGDDVREGTSLKGTVADRKVYFVEAGTTWEITTSNKINAEYRQIVFEFQQSKPNYTDQEIQEMFTKSIHSTNVGTALLFENELCRCWDFYLEPSEGGGADTVHHHCLDYVFINVAPSRLLGIDPKTLSLDDLLFDSVSEDNQVTWTSIPRDAATDVSFAHGGKNGYDDRPMREYLIELK